MDDESDNIIPLFESILENVKPADSNVEAPFRMQVANLDYDNFLGRM